MENGAEEASSTPHQVGVSMKGMPTQGVVGQEARHPSAILLVVQLLGVLLYPVIETGGVGAVLFEIFGAAVLALAIWATLDSPGPVPRWTRLRRCCMHFSTSGPRAA